MTIEPKKKYEVLSSLPTYGPMYISVTHTPGPFYSEGFVVRFFKDDTTDWVANFEPGWTDLYEVYDNIDSEIVIVIAGGQGYVINPNETQAKELFGLTIKSILLDNDNNLICINDTEIFAVNKSGEIWRTERISWDGIKDVELKDNVLKGLSFDPMYDSDSWVPFQIDLQTREIIGGSFRAYEKKASQQTKNITNRPWWKFW